MNETKLPRSLQGVIATTMGWVNPKTGELLKAAKNLPGAVEGYRPNSLKSLEVVEVDSITETPVVETEPVVIEPVAEEVKEEVKPKASRKKKA